MPFVAPLTVNVPPPVASIWRVASLGTVIPARALLLGVVGVIIAVMVSENPDKSKTTCAPAGMVRFPPVTVSFVGPVIVVPKQIVVPLLVAAANAPCKSTKVEGVVVQVVAEAGDKLPRPLLQIRAVRIAAVVSTFRM